MTRQKSNEEILRDKFGSLVDYTIDVDNYEQQKTDIKNALERDAAAGYEV